MFYLLMVPVLLMEVCMLLYLYRRRRHDKVLFRFCQIRRDLMQLLRDRGSSLSREEYKDARELLNVLSFTIHNYRDQKTKIFDGRKFLRFRNSAEKIRQAEPSADPEIAALYVRTAHALVRGFIAYTPFFASELALRLVLLGAQMLGNLGIRKMRRAFEVIQATALVIRRESDEFGLPPGRHA